MKNTAISPGRGRAERKRVDGKAKAQSSATIAARGARRNYATEKEKKKLQSCATGVGVTKIPKTPPAPRGEDRQDEKETNTKNDSPVPQLSGPITQTTARH